MPVDIIIIAAVAAFILLRLRGVLGQKIGHDKPFNIDEISREGDRVIQLKPVREESKDVTHDALVEEVEEDDDVSDEMQEALANIRRIDSGFRRKDFLQGAEMAFEMILESYAKGEKETLKQLLSKELYKRFASEVDKRKDLDDWTESTLVSVGDMEITDLKVEKSKAKITVKILSEQIQVTRQQDGNVADGSATDVSTVEDVWCFERDLRSNNPNWTITQV